MTEFGTPPAGDSGDSSEEIKQHCKMMCDSFESEGLEGITCHVNENGDGLVVESLNEQVNVKDHEEKIKKLAEEHCPDVDVEIKG